MTIQYRTIATGDDSVESTGRVKSLPRHRPAPDGKKRERRDRRKRKHDRRKSVREGVIVNISSTNDRRTGRDRRKK